LIVMPSLRERTKRPSYALLADPLEGLGLSDEDRDSDASHAEGSQAGSKRRAKSVSSGSTNFGATNTSGPQDEKGKGAAKIKGKGKGKERANDDSGSEFEGPSSEDEDDDMEDEAVDEVEEEAQAEEANIEDDEDDKEDDLVAIDSPPPSKPPPRKMIPTAFTNTPSHSNQAAFVQSEANLIPQQYRQLIIKHSEIIAAPMRGKPTVTPKERDYTARTLNPIVLPHGPSTPFVTRLKKELKGRERADVIYDQRLGHEMNPEREKMNRQRNSLMVVKSVTLAAPWQIWQGEGWWPEMASGHSASAHRRIGHGAPQNEKGIPKTARGWTPRDEVRLGLDHVGRYTIEQMRVLSKE
jgi:transcription factor C subunit 6